MSRITKWKLEKAKVKVVFRLQFHATQIPQSGWEKLFISFIPTETGKVSAKTSKANVRNGSCKWADPIYETTRLLIDSKTKQYDDKLYKLVVGMGTSRSSILGEATINLADYADASQPSAINLPLHGSDQGTILHVTVQLLTAKTGFREFEQQRDKGLQRESEPSVTKSPSSDILIPDDQPSKVKTHRQDRPQSKDLLEEAGVHEEYSDSQVTCDDSSNTSENYKYDPSITHEVDSIKSRVSRSEKRKDSDDLAIAYEENQRLRASLEVAESSISELKMEVNTLQNHANEMSTETQKLQQELAIEVASGQELMKEVTVLKSECSKFKNDLQQLKEMKSISQIPSLPLQELGSTTAIDSTEGQHLELLNELNIAKAERESLVKKMEQMECYYEALVQDLEENQKKILGEFQSLKNEHSTCAYSMNDQMLRFEEEKRELSSINKDLQKRTTTSESALKRARLNYSIAVSQLQKDLDMLSFQVLSMFETNQTVIKEAFSDSSQGHEDLVDDHLSKSKNLSGGGDVLSGDLKKSLSLQENIYKKVEEELGEMCSANLYLDVYSGTLKGTLIEASVHIRKMKEKLQELEHELEDSNQSKDVLFMRLQTAMEDVNVLNSQNAYYLSKCNDMQLQNQLLETDLGNVSRENFLLMEKITECEALVMEYRVHKSKHEVVSAEKLEVESLLEVQVFDNQKLQKDLSLVKEELERLRSQMHDLEKEKDMARSELDDVKRRFNNGLHEMVVKLGNPNESLEKVQFQLESVSNKLKNSLESGERHVENSEVILTYLSSLELELQKMSSEDRNFVEKITGLEIMAEEFEKSKLLTSKLNQENQDLMRDVEDKREEIGKLMLELDGVKESLRFVNDELDVEKGMKNNLEGIVARLTLDLESQRSEVDHVRKLASNQESESSRLSHEIMIREDLKLTFVKSQYESKIEELVKQCKELDKKNLDKEARLKESAALYVTENEKLSTTLESFRLELEAKTLESNNAIEEWKEKVGMLQVKLNDTEERLNEVVKSEANYVKENESLSKTLESVQLELEAKTLESNNAIEEWKEKVGMLQVKLNDTEERLNEVVKSEANYVKENESLSKTLESVQLELEAKTLESNNAIEEWKEKVGMLQVKLNDTEERLNEVVKSEANYVKENESLSKTLESVQLELEAKTLESNNAIEEWKEKVGMLQVKLNDTEERLNEVVKSEANYVKENESLSKTLESVQLELEAKTLESNNAIEEWKEKVGMLQVKLHDTEERLNEVVKSEANYVKENEFLSKTLESVQLELEASVASNAEISESKRMLEVSLMDVSNEHGVKESQMKDILAKSESDLGQLKELQVKLHDMEARLSEVVKSEAHYMEENELLSKTLESLKLELKDSIAEKAVMSESINEHVLEIGQLKDKLVKSEVETCQYQELQVKLHETESRLNKCLENEAHYIKETNNLEKELASCRLNLEASIAHNAEISEANNEHALEKSQLKDMLAKSEVEIGQLQVKLHDTESRLNKCLENEAHYIKETNNLETELESCRLKLEASIAHNAEISKSNNIKLKMLETSLMEANHKHDAEVGQLKELETELLDTKERLDQIVKSEAFYIEENKSLKSELDAIKKKVIFLENNKVVDEVLFMREESEILLVVLKAKLDEKNDELIKIQNKCNELTNKLSEQILKTEEFKNLSVSLKELKENTEINKKEPEGPTESLRMAFIKEQHQAKLQELKQQLSVSKRHNEEMLFKLQDSLDEIESRKKSEALHLKRIEELEAEVESVISEKSDHDRIQAELECAILSLECCKEEKEKLVALLQESEEEKSKLAVEVSLIKEQVSQKDENGHMGINGESKHSITPVNNLLAIQEGVHGEDEDNSLINDSKQLMVVNDQFRSQHLKSCMEQLDEELERMKNDNSILPLTNYDPGFQDLHSELSQLQKANEELGSIYPNFIDFPGNGNALQRVLALEIELAEALRTKKKSSIQFQSSFLKQHSDEEAVFKSFRDINELIKDMLEIKGKYVNVESELKEMHERYSQLSLEFAEVEGERQKLMMTLKNVRSSRNLLRLNRSSMAAIEDRKISENDAVL